jgi:hypothetical protein
MNDEDIIRWKRHEGLSWRTLGYTKKDFPMGITLDARERQLRDEDKSCGSQPAHIRVIYRRAMPLMPAPPRNNKRQRLAGGS